MIVKYVPDATDRFSKNFISREARKMIADGVYPEQDKDDLIQDLTTALWQSMPNYDPECSEWTTWVKTVVERRSNSLRRVQSTMRRKIESSMTSLSTMIADEDGLPAELGRVIEKDATYSRIGAEESDWQTQQDVRLDVEAALARLPLELQQVCEQLKHWKVAEGARNLGIARSTFVARMNRAREHLERLGLQDYVQPDQ